MQSKVLETVVFISSDTFCKIKRNVESGMFWFYLFTYMPHCRSHCSEVLEGIYVDKIWRCSSSWMTAVCKSMCVSK